MGLAIFGCGGYGREVLKAAEFTQGFARKTSKQPCIVFIEDSERLEYAGYPVIRSSEVDLHTRIVIAVGDPSTRKDISGRFASNQFGSVRSSTTVVGQGVSIAPGAILNEFTMITADAVIGKHFHCNIYSYVAHDCIIGDFVTFAPRVSCNGNVVIEDDVYVGTGALIKPGRSTSPITIGRGAVIGMGAVVTKSVPPGVTVVGSPARPLNPS